MSVRRKALLLVSLVSLLVVAEAIPPRETPVAKAEVVQDVFKITVNTATMAQPGCPGCAEMTTTVPQYEPNSGFSALANARKIDTQNPAQYGTSWTEANDGGCGITQSRGLLCWGRNYFGQLGNGTRTDAATPVAATGVSDVIDVATSVDTTCVVTGDARLRCVGAGGWPGVATTSREQVGGTYVVTGSTSSYTAMTNGRWSCSVTMNGTETVNIAVPDVSQVTGMRSCESMSTTWIDIATDARRVFLVGTGGWPTVLCYLNADSQVKCADWNPGTTSSGNENSTTVYDCDNDPSTGTSGFEETAWCQNSPTNYRYRQTFDNVSSRTANGAITWKDLGIAGVEDVAVADGSFGWGNSICVVVAGQVKCSTYTRDGIGGTGRFSDPTTIDGAISAEKVYVTSYGNAGLCVYGAKTLSCGNSTWANNRYVFPTEVTTVGVMERPLSVFYSTVGSNATTLSKLFIVLETGILSTDQWAFSACTGCYGNNSNTLAPLTAFKNASESTYFVASGVSGPTDSPSFIPLTVENGSRDEISSKMVKVTSADGTPLKDTTVTWAAPDIPGILRSSSSISNNKTNADGNVRFFGLRSGPITFTLSGGAAGGSYLQAANVTITVASSGVAAVTVPQPQPVVTRTIRVQLPDATPVPNAIISLRNNYLQYQYSNSGTSTSSWSAQAPVTGLFGQVSCTYCYVPPPVYITGADGSVSFPSYVPASRSTKYDLGISYDDTFINQSLRCTATPSPCLVTALDQTFTLGFMAAVQTKVADQDPSTPSQIDVVPGADGVVEVPLEILDPDDIPMEDISIEAEDICGTLLNGGLWTGSNSRSMGSSMPMYTGPTAATSSTTNCSTSVTGATISPLPCGSLGASPCGMPTTTTTPVMRSSVRAANATCARTVTGRTDTAGRAKLVLCPTQSGFFRIRGDGALPSREICVKVKGVECSRTAAMASSVTTAPGGGQNAIINTSPPWTGIQRVTALKRGKKVSLTSFRKLTKTKKKAGKITITATGPCTIKGKSLVADKKLKGTCKVTVLQANKGKVKGVKKTFKVRIT